MNDIYLNIIFHVKDSQTLIALHNTITNFKMLFHQKYVIDTLASTILNMNSIFSSGTPKVFKNFNDLIKAVKLVEDRKAWLLGYC